MRKRSGFGRLQNLRRVSPFCIDGTDAEIEVPMHQNLIRSAELIGVDCNPAELSVPVVISTETPVDRGSYLEVLGHADGDVDLSRAPLPLIESHDSSMLNIGTVEDLRLDNGKLRGTARFARSIPRALEVYQAIVDGIVRHVSVGYRLLDDGQPAGPYTLRFKWAPHEVSAVAVPADPRAGFFRSAKNTPLSLKKSSKEFSMSQVDLSPNAGDFSLIRAIAAAASGDWTRAGYEREVSQEIAHRAGRDPRGLFVPFSALATRTLTTAGGSGGPLVPTEHLELIDILRPAAKVVEMGATVMSGLQGNVEMPAQNASATGAWIAEDDALTPSDLAFSTVGLTPKTVGSMTQWSRRMLLQSVPQIEDIARRDLAAVIGRAIDQAALHGTGANNQPSGLYVASDVNSVAMGGVPTFGKLVDMVGRVAEDNALAGRLGFITTPGMAAKMAQTLKASAAGSEMIWTGSLLDGMLAGEKAAATSQALATLGAGSEHAILFGNWQELMIGLFSGIDLLVDPYTYADRGRVRLTAFCDLDIAVRHGQSFCKATGATIV